jgi:hypothetical protein
MKWTSIKSKKPKESKKYYWKGKDGYGGYNYYYSQTNKWDFKDTSNPKLSDEHLMWLEETTIIDKIINLFTKKN